MPSSHYEVEHGSKGTHVTDACIQVEAGIMQQLFGWSNELTFMIALSIPSVYVCPQGRNLKLPWRRAWVRKFKDIPVNWLAHKFDRP